MGRKVGREVVFADIVVVQVQGGLSFHLSEHGSESDDLVQFNKQVPYFWSFSSWLCLWDQDWHWVS